MYYRSDWPEVGLPGSLNERCAGDFASPATSDTRWSQETKALGVLFRWSAGQSRFESDLYGLPIWELRLEAEDIAGDVLASWSRSTFRDNVRRTALQALDAPFWGDGYVSCKLVVDEPLCEVLLRAGFEVVEKRRIFRCKVRDLATRQGIQQPEGVRFTTLAAVNPEHSAMFRRQILGICKEAFEGKGYSRHFTDPVLVSRMPGIAYIMAVMERNFEQVPLNRFLVAVDSASGEVCGFSAVGQKPGLPEATYTQLLSAVKREFRGLGVYHGLTALLAEVLPKEATLMNVVQTENLAIQRAYQGSARVHLADTLVLRQVYPVNSEKPRTGFRSLLSCPGSS